MASDTRALFKAPGDDDVISVSAVMLDLHTKLSFNVKKDIIKLLQELGNYEQFPTKGCSCIGRLWNICSSCHDNILEIMNLVISHNITNTLVIMLEGLKSSGYFSTRLLGGSDLWNTSSRLFDCVCLFSNYSEDFCINLVNSGILCLLVGNFELCKDKTLLEDKKSFFIVKATLSLVKNLVRNLPKQKATLRKCFWTYLQNFRSVEELNVLATMCEVCLCDRHEIKRKTESSETVLSLIHWINLSYLVLDNQTSWHAMFNLQDAIVSLRTLANFGNAKTFCNKVVMVSFHRILTEATIHDQIPTVGIIWTLCFDPEFEPFKRDKIISTLKLKERSEENQKLVYNIKAVLTIVRQRYMPRSASFEGYKASSDVHALIAYHKNNEATAYLLQTKLEAENVSTQLNTPNEEDRKYFDKGVVAIHKCYCVILCISEFTELDNESRTIAYIAENLNKDVIVVYLQKGIQLEGWMLQELADKTSFHFTEGSDNVSVMATLLLDKSISFSRKSHELRHTRSCGSSTSQSRLSVKSNDSRTSLVSNDSIASSISSDNAFSSMDGIGRQNSSDKTSRKSLSRLSLSSNQQTGLSSPLSPISPSSASSPSSSTSLDSLSGTLPVPEKFTKMKNKDVLKWLKDLNIGINFRDFKGVDGRQLYELFTVCQSSNPTDQNCYHQLMSHFHLSEDKERRFKAALLQL